MFKKQQTSPKPKLRLPSFLSELVGTLIFIIAITVIFDLVIPRSLVDGQSMEPTFQHNDRLVVSRINYLFDTPKRGDIIVFNAVVPQDSARGIMLIKRVIGKPGDTIEIRNQQVWLNGQYINEPYIYEACSVIKCQDNVWLLGEDEYFVMGDNRNHSNDSRSFDVVPYNYIIGQVIFRYWPLSSIGIIAE